MTNLQFRPRDSHERGQVNNTTFVYSGLGCDCESNSAGNTFYTHDNRGQLIDERTPTGTFYYLFDGLGSVVGLTDSTGALVGNETYHYDPYGLLIRQPHSAPLRVNPWRFASGFYDVSTGLYKFGIRYYDPNVGRWTQRDPVGGSLTETVKANPYGYADDDPVNETDLNGRGDIFLCALGIAGAIVGIGGGLAGLIAAVLLAGPELAGAALIGTYFGISAAFFGWLGGLIAALATWYSGVCDFSS